MNENEYQTGSLLKILFTFVYLYLCIYILYAMHSSGLGIVCDLCVMFEQGLYRQDLGKICKRAQWELRLNFLIYVKM